MSAGGVVGQTGSPAADASKASLDPVEAVATAAFVAAVAAAFTGAAPTGTTWWDPLLNAAFAAAFVVFASRANPAVLVACAGVAAALVGPTPWLAFGLAAFAAAIGASFRRDKRVELQALAGALAVTALLHLRPSGFFGLPSIVAGGAFCAVAASWFRAAKPATRRRASQSVGALAFVIVVLLGIAAVVGLSVRTTATEGVEAARQGLSSARAGDPQQLTAQLEIAADRLTEASDRIDSPLLKPLYLLPVASQHLRAASVASQQGALVAAEAAAAVVEADIGELQLRQGQFDLDLLTDMAPRLQSVSTQLGTSVTRIGQARSSWLLPPIDERIELLVDEVRDVAPEAQIAAEAAQVVPQMLGADGERRYLMLFGAPAESRDFGGFVGGYALLGVNEGRIALLSAGSPNDLPLLTELNALQDLTKYPTQFIEADPQTFPQNLTATANLEVIAQAARDLFPDLLGAPIDGVIYADPFALGAFTELTGPITVAGLDEPLFGQAVADFIFDGQYRIFERIERDLRFETMGALAAATASAFQQADLPGPERLGQVLGPVARAGRLQVITYDDRENAFLSSVLLQRRFIAPDTIDSVAVIQSNGTESKLDIFLHRAIEYDVAVDENGSLQATAEVTLTSIVPGDVPEITFGNTPDGTNQILLSLYSQHELVGLTVNGEPHEYVTQQEFGFFRYALFKIPLAVNTEAVVRFELVGVAPEMPYRLGVWAQPLVNPDSMTVRYQVSQQPVVERRQDLVENWVFDPLSEN